MRWVVLVVALSGCDLVFPTTHAPAPDGPASPFDEDGDRFDDDHDMCPGIRDAQNDTDGDGIGDPCDAHPQIGRDRLVTREFFNDAPVTWQIDSSWRVDHGRLVSTQAPATTQALLHTSVQAIDAPTVELRFEPLDYAGTQMKAIELELQLDGNTAVCIYNGDSGGGVLRSGTAQLDGDVTTDIPTNPGHVAVNASVTMRATVDDAGLACDFNGTIIHAVSPFMPNTQVSAKITVQGMQVAIDYVLVYDFKRGAAL